jgi:hypothetical protein
MDERRLKKYFHFNDNDLFYNRTGRLSEIQSKRLLEQAKEEQKSARDSAGILFVIAAFGMLVGLVFVFTAPVIGKILIGALLCVIWPGAWGWKGWTILREARSGTLSPLRAARGRVHVARHADPNGSVDFVLEVGDCQFDVDDGMSGMLEEGETCAVYYLEDTEEIMSVEAWDGSKNVAGIF